MQHFTFPTRKPRSLTSANNPKLHACSGNHHKNNAYGAISFFHNVGIYISRRYASGV